MILGNKNTPFNPLKNFSLKIQNGHFNSFHQVQFQENLKNRFKKEFISAISAQKYPIYPDPGTRIFLKNTKQSLETTFNASSQVQFHIKPMNGY